MPDNLYVHFPFCRRKCSYCALYSRAGTTAADRKEYVARLAAAVQSLPPGRFRTVYFGGGSPALCELGPLFAALADRIADGCEFTVELHPLDVTDELLAALKSGGVNRISMGVQSLDDAILKDMGRGYTFDEAERAFAKVKRYFDNAGIDLIVGYPGETAAITPQHSRLAEWGLTHCSVYSLILEEKSILFHRLNRGLSPANRGLSPDNQPPTTNHQQPTTLPSDDMVLDRIREVSRFLKGIGLERYEISNYAVPGFECRHNLAVWRGEDYLGLGDGAHGRVGLLRTENMWSLPSKPDDTQNQQLTTNNQQLPTSVSPRIESVGTETDAIERKIFRLRTREGLSISANQQPTSSNQQPTWGQTLDKFAKEGLLTRNGTVYRLTERGTEVCDSIMAELV